MRATWLQPELIDVGRPASLRVVHPTRRGAITASTRPWLTIGVLVLSDLLLVTLAWSTAVLGRWWLGGAYELSFYASFWPVLGVFVLAYAVGRLYPSIPLVPVEELRRVSVITTLVYLSLVAGTFLIKDAEAFSRAVVLVSWVLTLVLVPVGRVALRACLARQRWWGTSVVVVGNTAMGRRTVEMLLSHPEIGLKPIAVISREREQKGHVHGVPVIGGLGRAPRLARREGVTHAILTTSDTESQAFERLLQKLSRSFRHLIFVPQLTGLASLGVSSMDFGGTLALEVRHRLLDSGRQTIKRLLDLMLVLISLPVVLPMVVVIAWLIRRDSPGPALFSQERVGRGGRPFMAWKFRSMVVDADEKLAEALGDDPKTREQWRSLRKIKDDPRVTRVGAILRKTSLDELPQLWNVVKGEMSLVGPRPIIREETLRYEQFYPLYKRVRPGLTGLWQVSGRSDVDFRQRVYIDAYYVRNWSVWLDFYVLLRTIRTVLGCRGAY
ncbi:undecaprenyl-phosphate galactose phosphotransferase WbaP [Phycisphaerales bacterium AB-hyl4]|uniref:Undecaprenyl-phosphate galactose phosphotransferase WbaP n=1 Tax=Natronomicrosphaera hydrolytica TaxID=3242702 RepID=A0ABV4U5R7_9BACT